MTEEVIAACRRTAFVSGRFRLMHGKHLQYTKVVQYSASGLESTKLEVQPQPTGLDIVGSQVMAWPMTLLSKVYLYFPGATSSCYKTGCLHGKMAKISNCDFLIEGSEDRTVKIQLKECPSRGKQNPASRKRSRRQLPWPRSRF